MLRGDKLTLAYLLVQFLIRLALEWEVTAEQGVQKNPARPYVRRRAQVVLFLDYLRGHVGGGPAKNLKFGVRGRAAAEPEVNKFKFSCFPINEDIL